MKFIVSGNVVVAHNKVLSVINLATYSCIAVRKYFLSGSLSSSSALSNIWDGDMMTNLVPIGMQTASLKAPRSSAVQGFRAIVKDDLACHLDDFVIVSSGSFRHTFLHDFVLHRPIVRNTDLHLPCLQGTHFSCIPRKEQRLPTCRVS
jgi:hypothetical protein